MTPKRSEADKADQAEKALVRKVAGLFLALGELREKENALLEEINELLGGGPGIGAKLKALERSFDAAWGARYAGGQSGRYVWSYVKDKPQMKRLLRMLDVGELEQRILNYFRSDDPFHVKARHSFPIFVACINSLASESAPAEDFDLEAPVDCKHAPPCKSDTEHTRRKLRESRA